MKQLSHFSEIILLIVAGSVLSEPPPKLTLHLNEQIIKTEEAAPSKFGGSEFSKRSDYRDMVLGSLGSLVAW